MTTRVREPTRAPAPPGQSTARRTQLVPRVRYTRNRTRIWSRLNLALAVIGIAAMVALVVLSFVSPGGVANYRGGLLTLHGVLALQVISAGIDQEFVDFGLSIGAAFLALAADVTAALFSWRTVAECATDIDNSICINESTEGTVFAVVATALAIFALVHLVTLFIWLATRRNYLITLANNTLFYQRSSKVRRQSAGPLRRDIRTTSGTPYAGLSRDAALFEATETEQNLAMSQAEMAVRFNTRAAAGGATLLAVLRVLAVLGLLAVLFVAVVNAIFIYEASFYRAIFLVVPAHLFGAQLAFFGAVPKWWGIIVLVFGLLSLGSATYGAVFDLQRYFRCVLDSQSPQGQIETLICADEAWRGGVVPWVLLFVALTGLVAVISGIASLTQPSYSRRGVAVV